jgi:hypothetical protein
MIVFIVTDNGTGWISRGGDNLTSLTEFAKRFPTKKEAEAGIAHLHDLIKRNETGWEYASIYQAEIMPDDAKERPTIRAS